jgi:hypothetical protein
MRRIKSQRETFAYRFAADAVSGDNPKKKKDDYFGLDIPEVDQQRNLDALPGGGSSADYYNQQAKEEETGPAGTSGRMQQMTINPGFGAGGNSGGGSASGSGGAGGVGANNIMDVSRSLYDHLMKEFPGSNIGGYRPGGDGYNEHNRGALDFMNPGDPQKVMQEAFAAGAPYVLWQQQQWNPDGSRSPMEDRGDPTQNHFDHIHIAPPPPGGFHVPSGSISI